MQGMIPRAGLLTETSMAQSPELEKDLRRHWKKKPKEILVCAWLLLPLPTFRPLAALTHP